MIAVLDANVLYPAPVRDYLLHLASMELYQAKWSNAIQEEWILNLLLNRKDLNRSQLNKTKTAMNAAFPDANVTGYEPLIEKLALPDKDDRHVLAAAIQAKADLIITSNIKDFPSKNLKAYGVDAQTADEFIIRLMDKDKARCVQALNNQVQLLRNPLRTRDEVLDTLENCGLINSVKLLRS